MILLCIPAQARSRHTAVNSTEIRGKSTLPRLFLRYFPLRDTPCLHTEMLQQQHHTSLPQFYPERWWVLTHPTLPTRHYVFRSSINKIINTEITFWSFAKPVSCMQASRYDVSSYIDLGTKLASSTTQSQATQHSRGNLECRAPLLHLMLQSRQLPLNT